jgi:hypothetical protein
MVRATLVAAWLSGAAVAAASADDPGAVECERGEQQVRGLEFAPAVVSFEKAISVSRQKPWVIRSYAGLAQAAAAAGNPEKAHDAFQVLLALAPDWRPPPGASPRVQDPYEKARAFWATQGGFALALSVPSAVPAQQNVTAQVRLEGDPLKLIGRVVVKWRRDDGTSAAQLLAPGADSVVIPGAEVMPPGLEVWAVGLSDKGVEYLASNKTRIDVSGTLPPVVTAPTVGLESKTSALLHVAALGFYDPLTRRLGLEAQLSVTVGSVAEVLAGAIIGQNPGIRAGVTLHPSRTQHTTFSWLVQPRIGVYPLPQGVAFGAGLGAGGSFDVWRGRALAVAGFEVYKAPSGYSPYVLMLSLGYEIDFFGG